MQYQYIFAHLADIPPTVIIFFMWWRLKTQTALKLDFDDLNN